MFAPSICANRQKHVDKKSVQQNNSRNKKERTTTTKEKNKKTNIIRFIQAQKIVWFNSAQNQKISGEFQLCDSIKAETTAISSGFATNWKTNKNTNKERMKEEEKSCAHLHCRVKQQPNENKTKIANSGSGHLPSCVSINLENESPLWRFSSFFSLLQLRKSERETTRKKKNQTLKTQQL